MPSELLWKKKQTFYSLFISDSVIRDSLMKILLLLISLVFSLGTVGYTHSIYAEK